MNMNITFECFGLVLDAEGEYFPGEAPQLAGPPEAWSDGYPDDFEFERLVCIVEEMDGKKIYNAEFLLYSSDIDTLIDAALLEARVVYKDSIADNEAEAYAAVEDIQF